MKSLNVKSAVISAIIVQVIGVSAFVGSHFVMIMSDPELQANLVLAITLIPATMVGAHIYYRKGYETSGFILGAAMFFVAIVLDALVTVPLLVIPAGGSHAAFFGDPGFWMIGVLYVGMVAAYRHISKSIKASRVTSA